MARPQDIARSSRARPCTFILPDDSEITIQPPGVDQVIACLRLDPPRNDAARLADMAKQLRAAGYEVELPAAPIVETVVPETPLEEFERARAQFRHLAGPANAYLSGVLDAFQLAQMTGALYASSMGMDAEAFAAWQAKIHEEKVAITAEVAMTQLEDLTVEMAAEFEKLPSEVGAQPLADLLAARERLARLRRGQRAFDAAVHDKKLEG